jgi:methyl-accepting chemotaxis protein
VVAEITKVLMEQNESSKDVAQKVDTIAQGIESNSVSVAKTAEAARQLADLSSELARLAGHFRID